MADQRRLEVYRDKSGEWRWRLKAANNKIVADSGEGYEHQEDAVSMATSLFEQPFDVAYLEEE